MAETFEILAGFLERFGAEVEGREAQEPTEEAKAQLRKLARGSLEEAEQGKLYVLLNQNPEWVAWLAHEVKALRGWPT
jgi:hypothetical protein